MRKEDFYWYWFNNIDGVGRGTMRKLLMEYGSPEQIYHADEKSVRSFLHNAQTGQAFSMSKKEEYIIGSYQKLLDKQVIFIHPDCADYPERLRVIPDSPMGLYLKGHFPEKEKKAIAIIGARNCTRYGKEMARFFGRELSKCGISIISGLARGIDGMAHEGAIEAGGYTLGVLGCGIDRIYPEENYRLFMQMEKTGGILSESNIGIRPVAGLFPQRNRLIAGLSDGILVVEAMEKSGTFITVDQGLEQGKDIFALPGRVMDIKSAGCNNLIKLGAHMVTEVSDILEVLNVDKQEVPELSRNTRLESVEKKISLAPLEKMVYSCLQIEPKYLDDIICETRIAPQEVCMILNRLVMNGVIVESARNYYAIKL